MFSSDLANTFGGRYIEIKIQPFSFKEFYTAYLTKNNLKEKPLQEVYNYYISESAFPQTIEFAGKKQLITDYLMNTVYLNTIQKDIIKRFNIQYTDKLDSVVKYIFDNIGNETSFRNISNALEFAGQKTSIPSSEYINRLIKTAELKSNFKDSTKKFLCILHNCNPSLSIFFISIYPLFLYIKIYIFLFKKTNLFFIKKLRCIK